MLEGLPPNNAAHVMRVTLDEARARAVADLMVESFEPAEAASTAFETETAWPGGGKAWAVEVYFGFEPDEEALRELVAAAAGEDAAALAAFGITEKQDWVANALAGLKPVRAGRFVVHGAHDRDKVGGSDIGIEIEAGLAFGTGHHGTTRGCLLHLDALLKRRRPAHVLDVGCGAGVLAIAAARVLRKKVWLGDIDPVAVEVANANSALNGVGGFARAIVSRGVENCALREGAPYDLVFANILAKPLRWLAPSLAGVPLAHAKSPAVVIPKHRYSLFHRTGLSKSHRNVLPIAIFTCQPSTWSNLSAIYPVHTDGPPPPQPSPKRGRGPPAAALAAETR